MVRGLRNGWGDSEKTPDYESLWADRSRVDGAQGCLNQHLSNCTVNIHTNPLPPPMDLVKMQILTQQVGSGVHFFLRRSQVMPLQLGQAVDQGQLGPWTAH